MRQPDRAERHWLAMAVALLWMVTLGGEQESFHDEELISDLSKTPQLTATRQISCFLNGLLTIVAQLRLGSISDLRSLISYILQSFQRLGFF
ncbi:MAG: hypothetical protein QNJ72_14620 [Pleurocapsa sp. MO_226.B13]|nr:hypothetical protein [Pleurocapsa sp. MO_226.B13]